LPTTLFAVHRRGAATNAAAALFIRWRGERCGKAVVAEAFQEARRSVLLVGRHRGYHHHHFGGPGHLVVIRRLASNGVVTVGVVDRLWGGWPY
jgi:hypothetical protein